MFLLKMANSGETNYSYFLYEGKYLSFEIPNFEHFIRISLEVIKDKIMVLSKLDTHSHLFANVGTTFFKWGRI